MPDGRLLVTERPGRVRVIDASGDLLPQPAYTSLGGSFLGLAIHPNYATNKFVYLYNNYSDAGTFKNRIQRFVYNGTTLTLSTTLLDGIPGDQTTNGHDGGRIKFGPDGKLYATTGDTFQGVPAQDLESLAGKILRLNAPGDATDGTAPADNPFPSATSNSRFVWTYGHRHPQGIAWDASGQLWETEHGPSGEAHAGGKCCRDELNRIDKGANYGWPTIMGDEQQAGMRSPVVSSGDTVAWAPGGVAFGPDGELYAPALIGQHLRQFSISGGQVTRQREHFRLDLGRLRTAVYAGGFLYLTTSNNSANERVLRVPINSQQQPSNSVVWAVGDANANADSQATANRIAGQIDRFLYLGDVYENGTAAEFASNFDPVWGRFKALTSPTPGNHEWANRATGYDPYWGARAPQTGGGHYYSFTENGWEVLSLNTEENMAVGSPQYEWLKQKLADGGNCRIAFFHRPRYVAPGSHSDATDVQPLWSLMANKVRLAVNGHAHAMMRAHAVDGITELVSGAGGHSHHAANPDPRFAFVNSTDFGVLRLKLNAVGSGGATFEHDFIATDDGAVLDSGTGTCTPPPPPSTLAKPATDVEDAKPNTGLSVTNKRFRVGDEPTALIAQRKTGKLAPKGTTFQYTLSQRSDVAIEIQRARKGVKLKRKGRKKLACVSATKKNRRTLVRQLVKRKSIQRLNGQRRKRALARATRKRRCTVYKRSGTLRRVGQGPGKVSTKFSGRLGNVKLPIGGYRAQLTATDAAGQRTRHNRVTFRVVRR